MTAPAPLDAQLAAEQVAKRREYVLANTRARWGIVAFAIVLLAGVRLAHIVPLSWLFLLGFAGGAAALNYAMQNVASVGTCKEIASAFGQ